MLGTIAIVTVLSAILVFFVDELMAYAKALVEKPYMFLVFGLLTLSALINVNITAALWLLITWWIGLLLVVQWLADHLLGNAAEQFLAKWVLVVLLPILPIFVALGLNWYKRENIFYNKGKAKNRAYWVALILSVSTLLLFVLGLPGSDLAG
ncbi:MAG: hypothetical protein NTU48_02110 [Legionellales bacterium]|jgi:hypothetical protein|nr:hypothetical protein [Legionellales bacterium]